MSEKNIGIKSSYGAPLISKITINDNLVYIINTEENGNNSTQACTRVYRNGKILYSREADYSHLKGTDHYESKLHVFMKHHHEDVVAKLNELIKKSQKKKAEYLSEAMSLFRNNENNMALEMLKDSLIVYPNDPVLLSYYGFVSTHVEKNPKEGIRICREAISKLEGISSLNREDMYAVVCLNLGRAYLRANKKKEAFRAFSIGLESNPTNSDLIAAIKMMGRRRKPLCPIMARDNPINKYFGLLFHKLIH